MFCKKCGQKLNDGSKFCPYCGATQSAPEAPAAAPAAPVSSPIPEPAAAPAPAPAPAAPAPAPVQPVIPAPAPAAPAPVQPSVPASKQGGSKGLIAGISIGVAVLVVLVALLVISLLGSPKSSVIKAIEKSSDEFSSVSELFGASVIKNASEKKSFTQDFELKIKSLGDNSYYDVSVMEGLGFRTSVGIDVEKQKMSGDIAAVYGSADLISGYLNVDKTAVSVYSPEFFGDDAIGLDTATLGEKLAEKTGDDSMADISFNIFDLVEAIPTSGEVDQEAVKVLVDTIEVEKEGKKEVEVNGADLKCTGYHVVVPEDAMVDYLDAAREQMESSAFIDNAEALYGSMGLPKDEIDTVISEMTEAMNLQYDAFEEIINEIGDLEFDVYLNKGLVADVIWEVEIDGEKAEIELQLGGEKEYINNVGLFITVDGETLAIESEGNHVPDGGVFTDTTLLSMKGNPLTIKIKTEYNTKETEDNLSISMKVAGQELMGVNGSLAVAKDSIALTFDELFITDGYQTYSMEGSYGFGPYKDVESPAKDTQNILDMSDEDLAKWAEEVEQNAGNLLSDLYVEYPDLANMLFS